MFSQQSNPTSTHEGLPEFQVNDGGNDYPHVLTTYMVTEQFLSGGVTRNTPHLNELMPSTFAEISKNLARKLGVKSAGSVTISTPRGEVTIAAMVTDRTQTLTVDGKAAEVIG